MSIEKSREFVGGGQLKQLEEEARKLGGEAAQLEEQEQKERQMGWTENVIKMTKIQRETKLKKQRDVLQKIDEIKKRSLREE